MAIASATDDRITVVTRDKGQKGDTGTAGLDGQGFNGVRQSLLDAPLCRLFTPNKLVDTLAGSLTATRATTATYVDRYGVVKTAAIDELREESEGWLIEGASTNANTFSEDFTDSDYTKEGVTVTANNAFAPDGTATADEITENTANARHRVFKSVFVTSGVKVTVSVFAKRNGRNFIELPAIINNGLADKDALFDLLNGTSTAGKIEPLGDDWFRCSHTYTTSNTSLTYQVRLSDGASISYEGDGTSGVFLWGLQVEELPFATSYIPTTTAAATRAADVITAPVRDNFVSGNQGDWSFSVIFETLGYRTSALFGHNGINDDTLSYSVVTGGGASIVVRDFDSSVGATAPYTEFKSTSYVAVREDLNLTGYTDTIAGASLQPTENNDFDLNGTVRIGAQENNINAYYGYMRDFRIYDFALNADEIAYLAGVK